MTRTAQEVAVILKEIYNQKFGDDECEKYRLGWPDLRGIAGVGRLEEPLITEISEQLAESGYALIPLSNFLLVGYKRDFSDARKLPARLLERYLPGEIADDDDVDDEEFIDD